MFAHRIPLQRAIVKPLKPATLMLGRFCADCKHNVVTAFDILTCKCDLADIDNEDEFLPDLFWPFAGRIGPVPGDVTGQKALLSCPLEVGGREVVWCGSVWFGGRCECSAVYLPV